MQAKPASYTLYLSANTLPLGIFIEISVTGDLTFLCNEGEAPNPVLEERWNQILQEWNDLMSDSMEQKVKNDLLVQILRLETKINGCQNFLAVLEKQGLMRDLQVNWGDDVNKEDVRLELNTQQFLIDNNLSTAFGSPQNKLHLPLVVSIMSAAGLFFISQQVSLSDNILLIFIVAALLVGNVYLWTHRTKAKSSGDRIVSFEKEGLFINQNKYDWKQIEDWDVLSSDTSSQLEILYNKDGKVQKMLFALEQTSASEIELLLLLSRFKATYG